MKHFLCGDDLFLSEEFHKTDTSDILTKKLAKFEEKKLKILMDF